jgi:hypothetical protein
MERKLLLATAFGMVCFGILAGQWLAGANVLAQDAVPGRGEVDVSGRVWEVVALDEVGGNSSGRYLMYNIRTGESYAVANKGDHWVHIPFPKEYESRKGLPKPVGSR